MVHSRATGHADADGRPEVPRRVSPSARVLAPSCQPVFPRISSCRRPARLGGGGNGLLWAAAAKRLAPVLRLTGRREQAAAWAHRNGATEPVLAIEAQDWDGAATAARALIHFLARWGRPPDAAIARGLSD